VIFDGAGFFALTINEISDRKRTVLWSFSRPRARGTGSTEKDQTELQQKNFSSATVNFQQAEAKVRLF
jgi:hypothetical protein